MLKEEPFKYRPSLKGVVGMVRFLMRFRTRPETLEPYLASLEQTGVPAVNVSNVRDVLVAWRQAYLDKAAVYRIDNYLTAGMAAVDLVLLTVVLPMGVPDLPLSIAVLSLAVSLVLVAWSLFVSFVKREQGITAYGTLHGMLVFWALVSGTAALTGTFWHISSVIGKVFLGLAVLAYLACVMYEVLARLSTIYVKIIAAASSTQVAADETPR